MALGERAVPLWTWKNEFGEYKFDKYFILNRSGFGMQSNQSEGRRAAAQSAANEGSSSDEQEDQVAHLANFSPVISDISIF